MARRSILQRLAIGFMLTLLLLTFSVGFILILTGTYIKSRPRDEHAAG